MASRYEFTESNIFDRFNFTKDGIIYEFNYDLKKEITDLFSEKVIKVKGLDDNGKFIFLISENQSMLIIEKSILKYNELEFIKNIIDKVEDKKVTFSINREKSNECCKNNVKSIIIKVGATIVTLLVLAYGSYFIANIIKNSDDLESTTETTYVIETEESRKEDISQLPTATENINNIPFFPYSDIDFISKNDDYYQTYFDLKSESNSKIVENTKKTYFDTIKKYADMYGVDPYLILAICIQETSGKHTTEINSNGSVGICGLDYSSYINQKKHVRVFNKDKGRFEDKVIIVTDDYIRSLEGSLELCCATIQKTFNVGKYNYFIGVTAYNNGPGNLEEVINNFKTDSRHDFKYDEYGSIDWMDYRDTINAADPIYFENTFRFLIPEELHFTNPDTGDEVVIRLGDVAHVYHDHYKLGRGRANG